MCQTCGCSDHTDVRITDVGHGHPHHAREHSHPHAHPHPDHEVPGPTSQVQGQEGRTWDVRSHEHEQRPGRTVQLEIDLLAKNDRLASENRTRLAQRGVVALNLMSSPGAGKTTLLERTIRDLAGEIPISVVEGDQETTRDAERIRATGCDVVQINTGSGCHLDAEMVTNAVARLDPPRASLLLIENVGNLVCPALFDLGERAKVVIASVTEGEDKPLKYPHMFRASRVMILNKIDLLPYVAFDVGRCLEYARRVNPRLEVFELSATRGDGLERWYGWLREQMEHAA